MKRIAQNRFSFLLTVCLWAGLVCAFFSFAGDTAGLVSVAFASSDDARPVPTRREFDLGLAACTSNGYLAEIQTKPNWETLLAVAISESGCNPDAVNGILCRGVFQVCPVNNPELLAKYKPMGLVSSIEDVKFKLNNSIKFSTRVASEDILGPRLSSMNKIAALCSYGGFKNPTQYNETNQCRSAARYIGLEKWVRGEEFSSETIVDIDDPNYSQTVFKDESGNVIASSLNCQDRSKVMAQALAKTARTYHLTSALQTQERFFETLEGTKNIQGHIHGDTLKAYCIESTFGYWDVAQILMDGAAWVAKRVLDFVNDALNSLCTFVVSYVASAIDNFLNKICLQIPNPSFELGFGSLKTKSCDGLTLGRALATSTGAMTADDLLSGFNQTIADSVFPMINSIPTLKASVKPMMFPMRRLFGETKTGEDDFH